MLNKDNNHLSKTQIIIVFLAFYIVGWFLFTFRITDVPPGINGDEAALGYNAALVARTGYDQSGRFLPIFISAQNLTDWKQPVSFYSTVLAFRLFGPSYSLLREVSVVFVLISATLIFLLGYELLGLKAAFISLLVFITIPIVLIQSHLALENIAPIPFVTLWLLMLVKYHKTLKQKFLLFAALSLGVSLYTYPGMRLIFPVLSLLTLIFIFYINRKKSIGVSSSIFKLLIVIAIFPLFMLIIKSHYPGAILAYNRPQSIKPYQELILPYLSSFDLSFLFIKGDTTAYHSTGRQGVFLLATWPLFALGIFRIAQKKDFVLNFILLTFLTIPLLYGLVGSIHRGSRLLALLPLFTVITTMGFLYLLDIRKKLWKLFSITLVVILLILNYADFVIDYWYEYPNRIKSEFARPYHKVFEKAYQLSKMHNLSPLIKYDFRLQNAVAIDFFEQVYFPNKLPVWKDGQLVPKDSIVIISGGSPKNLENVNYLAIEGTEYGLLINKSSI